MASKLYVCWLGWWSEISLCAKEVNIATEKNGISYHFVPAGGVLSFCRVLVFLCHQLYFLLVRCLYCSIGNSRD